MEALILQRITELLKVRKWYRINRWADWPDLRKENEVELRALVRLARAGRKIERAEFRDHPADETWTDREGQPEFNGAFDKW